MAQPNLHGFIGPSRIIGALLLIPAIALAGVAAWWYTSTTAFVNHAKSAPGVVTNLKPSSSGSNGTSYFAVFEFVDAEGIKRQATTEWSSNPPRYSVGENVVVLYSPDSPGDVRLKGFMGLWLGPTICGGLAAVDFFFAIVFLWFFPFMIRRRRPAPSPTFA